MLPGATHWSKCTDPILKERIVTLSEATSKIKLTS